MRSFYYLTLYSCELSSTKSTSTTTLFRPQFVSIVRLKVASHVMILSLSLAFIYRRRMNSSIPEDRRFAVLFI
jgi:hypothetical protein